MCLRRALPAALAAVVLATGAAAAAPPEPLIRTFRDFSASCSQLAGVCVAWTEGSDATLLVERAMAPGSSWAVSVRFGAGRVDRAAPLRFTAEGGAAFDVAPGSGWKPLRAPGEAYLVDGPAATELLGAMARAGGLAVSASAPGGARFERSFSLSGLSASLLWIDDRQGRLGSPRQAAAPAGLPEISAATEAAFARFEAEDNTLKDLPPALLRSRSREPDCAKPADLDPGGPSGFDVLALDGRTTLFVVFCELYAYQASSKLYLAHAPDWSDPKPLRVKEVEAGTARTTDSVMLYDLVPRLNQLTSTAKGRGVGDCGTVQTWRWDGAGMRLVEARYQDCVYKGAPKDADSWPIVFQEKADRR